MPENDVLLALSQQELNPNTNLPEEPVNDVLQTIYGLNVNRPNLRSVSPIQMGQYGPDERRVGESKYDYNILPEDIYYWNNLEAIRSHNQSGWAQLGNASVQALAEIVGGTIEAVGYSFSLSILSQAMKKGEKEFGNAISRFGKSIRDASREEFPVYTDAEGFDPGNWSWWMSNIPSIASSISLMIPSGAVVGVVRAISKGLRLASKIPTAVGRTMGVLGQAVASRHMESMMEAADSYDTIYEQNIADGMSVQDARKNAAIGASSVYKRDWAMLGQDVLQYAFLGNLGRSAKGLFKSAEETKALANAMGKSVGATVGKKALSGFGNMLGEFGEEAY
jgi:hypothetical protein